MYICQHGQLNTIELVRYATSEMRFRLLACKREATRPRIDHFIKTLEWGNCWSTDIFWSRGEAATERKSPVWFGGCSGLFLICEDAGSDVFAISPLCNVHFQMNPQSGRAGRIRFVWLFSTVYFRGKGEGAVAGVGGKISSLVLGWWATGGHGGNDRQGDLATCLLNPVEDLKKPSQLVPHFVVANLN